MIAGRLSLMSIASLICLRQKLFFLASTAASLAVILWPWLTLFSTCCQWSPVGCIFFETLALSSACFPHLGLLTIRASYLVNYAAHFLFVGFVFGVNTDGSDGVIRFVVNSQPLCMEDGGKFL